MPRTLTTNDPIRRECGRKSATEPPQLPEQARVTDGRLNMADAPVCCQFPCDVDGCRAALIQAWRDARLAEHCVTDGLKAGWMQCHRLLAEGVNPKAAAGKASRAQTDHNGVSGEDLKEACQDAVLLGCRSKLTASYEIVVAGFHQLVRYAIRKFNIKEPTSDDVFQNVFLNLLQAFRKDDFVRRASLATYIWHVTVNECLKEVRPPRTLQELRDVGPGYKIWPAAAPPAGPTPKVIDAWEELDQRIRDSDQGNVVNRIILAHKCLEGYRTGGKYPVKQLLRDWQRLARCTNRELAALHERAADQARRFPAYGVVPLAAEFINEGLAEPWQVAVVFAAAAGMDLSETHQLLTRLAGLSENAVNTRTCRMYVVLGSGGEPGDD